MRDQVFIDELKLPCKIGVTELERSEHQHVLVSLRIGFPLRDAGQSDELGKSLDYAAVVTAIRSLTATRTFKLVEALAEQVAAMVLTFSVVEDVAVRVAKASIPETRGVGVEIFRSRSEK